MPSPSIDSLQFVLAERLAPWLLTYGMHSSLLLVFALLVARRLRGAAAREWLWKLALVGPLVSASLQWGATSAPAVAVPRIDESQASAMPVGMAEAGLERVPLSSAVATVEVPVGGEFAASSSPGHELAAGEEHSATAWPLVLVCAWLLLALTSGVHFCLGRRRLVRRLGRRESLGEDALVEALARLTRGLALAGRVRLTESARLASPVALGRREICVPPRVREDLEPREQECLLAHELAHLVRRDPLWILLAHLLERVFFFQPLLRVVRGRLSEDMELLADAWAVRRTADPVRMARCLARVAEWMAAGEEPRLVPGMAAAPSQLVRRIESVLEPQDAPRARRSARLVAVIGLLGLGAVSYAAPRAHGMSASSRSLQQARRELGSSWAELLEGQQEVDAGSEATDVQPLSSSPEPPSTQESALSEVTISLGDSLRILDTYRSPEFDRTEIVQGLGSIMLPDLGRVVVLGKTRAELERELGETYAQYYQLCDIHVQHTPVAQRFFLYGAVRAAGPRALRQDTTVFEVLTAPATEQAGQDLGHVRLIRPHPTNPLVLTIDVEAMLATGDSSSNVLLRPGDILYVPASEEMPTAEAMARERRELQERIERYLAAQDAYRRLRGVRRADLRPVQVSPPVDPRERDRCITLSHGRLSYDGRGADIEVLDVEGDLAAGEAGQQLLDWLGRVSTLARQARGTTGDDGASIAEPVESLVLRATSGPGYFDEVAVILRACESLGLQARKVLLRSNSDGSRQVREPLAAGTGEVPEGVPRLEIELGPLPADSEQGVARPVNYSLRWDLLDKAYSASASFEGASLEAIVPVLADLASQAAEYHVVLVCQQGIVYHDVNALLDVVIEAGFSSVTFLGAEER